MAMQSPDLTNVRQSIVDHNREYERAISNIKKMTCHITAAFIRTCYIVLRNDNQENIPERLYTFYKCATIPHTPQTLNFSQENRLNLLMLIAVPSLFIKCQNRSISGAITQIIPFLNETSLQTQDFPSAHHSSTSLEMTLQGILNHLPPRICSLISEDLLSIKTQINQPNDVPRPPFNSRVTDGGIHIDIDPFYEKLIRVSLVALLFIKHTSFFIQNNTDILNAQDAAFDMIGTVGNALLHDPSPPSEMRRNSHLQPYIDPCIKIALSSIPESEESDSILRQLPPNIWPIYSD